MSSWKQHQAELDVLLAFGVLQVKDAQRTGRQKEQVESGNWSAWTVLNDTPIKEVVANLLHKVECVEIKVHDELMMMMMMMMITTITIIITIIPELLWVPPSLLSSG
jgi:hypothetical protein